MYLWPTQIHPVDPFFFLSEAPKTQIAEKEQHILALPAHWFHGQLHSSALRGEMLRHPALFVLFAAAECRTVCRGGWWWGLTLEGGFAGEGRR
jgi:hypothetical protein